MTHLSGLLGCGWCMLMEDVHDILVQLRHQDLDGLVRLAGDGSHEVLHGVHVPAVTVQASHAVGWRKFCKIYSRTKLYLLQLQNISPISWLPRWNVCAEVSVTQVFENSCVNKIFPEQINSVQLILNSQVCVYLDCVKVCKFRNNFSQTFNTVERSRGAAGLGTVQIFLLWIVI